MTLARQTEHVDFGGLRIAFDDRVLRPRPWTVAQAEWAAALIREAPPGPVLELCAGAGQIGLLAVHLTPRRLVAVERDPVACHYLRRNAQDACVRVDIREGPLDDVLGRDERFAVVIADPPWVPTSEVARHPEDPVPAIDGGLDGLALVRRCLVVTARHLVPGGSAVLQVGTPEQAATVADLLRDHPTLRPGEVRTFPRGTLMRVDQAPAAG